MKILQLLPVAIAISLTSCGQEIPASKVPSVVANVLQQKFPGVSDVDWEKEKTYYEAEFDLDNVEHDVQISETGIILQHKTEIDITLLPAAVQSAVESGYPGFSIDEAAKIEKDGQTNYEIELEAKGRKDKTILFSASGQPIASN